MPRMVWAEMSPVDGRAIRIFKNLKMAAQTSTYPNNIACVLRSIAVTEIRRAIWNRAKHTCEHCGDVVSWGVMQMHEKIWRGRGGEISLVNGACLCEDCHIDDPVAGHGKRKVQWSDPSKQV